MKYIESSRGLLDFINKSPSAYHVVENIRVELLQNGFSELSECGHWQIAKGGKYFTVRNDSSVVAFAIPDCDELKGYHIVASHSDSPAFKIKENPEIGVDAYVRLNTEKYGGMILSTWLDRPLSIAGRIAYRDGSGGKILTKTVNIDKDLLVIPNLAVHLNRDINKGYEYNPQIDMLPLFAMFNGKMSDREAANAKGSDEENSVLKILAEQSDIPQKDILGHDLFLYVREKGRIFGANDEFILSPRLDDLQCVYASVRAFVESSPEEYINVCAVFDNEEVGSGTRQGADSTLLEDVTGRIGEGLGFDSDAKFAMISGSFCISADNAHAHHPNHPEKSDPSNKPYLNGGIVIKFNGSQKYTTDAFSAAVMKDICVRADVPYQTYSNRSDIAGGMTLGNISTSHISVATVDIGLPQLAMHSAVETAGVYDTEYATGAFKVFYGE